jgi:hypothetical protein
LNVFIIYDGRITFDSSALEFNEGSLLLRGAGLERRESLRLVDLSVISLGIVKKVPETE